MTAAEIAEEIPASTSRLPGTKTFSSYAGFVAAAAVGAIGLLVATGDLDRSVGYLLSVAFAQLVMFWWARRVGDPPVLQLVGVAGVPAMAGTLLLVVASPPSSIALWIATVLHVLGYALGAFLLEYTFRDSDSARRKRRLADFAITWMASASVVLVVLQLVFDVTAEESPRVYLLAFAGMGLMSLACGLAWVEVRWNWNAVAVLTAAALFPILDFLRMWLMSTQQPGSVADILCYVPWVVFVAAICHPGGQSMRNWGPARTPLSGSSVAMTMSLASISGVVATLVGALAHPHNWFLVIVGVGVSAALCIRAALSVVDTHHALAMARAVQRASLTAREEERHEMGRLLHDGVLQQLAALRWTSASASAAELDDRVEAAIRSSREILTGIAKATPATSELPQAVDELSRSMGSRLTWSVTVHDSVRSVAGLDTAVWEIVGEGVANAEKHSRGTRGYVWAGKHKGAIEVRIVDDGRGTPVSRSSEGSGSGLRQLATVVADLNGTLRASSSVTGTSLVARFPI